MLQSPHVHKRRQLAPGCGSSRVEQKEASDIGNAIFCHFSHSLSLSVLLPRALSLLWYSLRTSGGNSPFSVDLLSSTAWVCEGAPFLQDRRQVLRFGVAPEKGKAQCSEQFARPDV
ncbi:hypothetical protein BaRGS_00004211 [Batillaria attramentaria]|uniref:Uncharacterized protein n=1 Tax=Batillaria attramentaria TaxID=370345 RepID=A0ABD0LYP0_9CAEN